MYLKSFVVRDAELDDARLGDVAVFEHRGGYRALVPLADLLVGHDEAFAIEWARPRAEELVREQIEAAREARRAQAA